MGMSLGSLKSQISALSVFFQQRLAPLPDVKTFMQGFAHVAPPVRAPAPLWHLTLVLRALQDPSFEPLSSVAHQKSFFCLLPQQDVYQNSVTFHADCLSLHSTMIGRFSAQFQLFYPK